MSTISFIKSYNPTLNSDTPVNSQLKPNAISSKDRVAASVIDPNIDHRKPIDNTLMFPYRCICKLRSTFSTIVEDGTGDGTGVLVAPNVVLTAAHVIHHPTLGLANTIEVVPGLNRTDLPFGSMISTNYRYPGKWTEKFDQEFDFGLVVLSQSIGNNIGYVGYAAVPDDKFGEISPVTIVGYPNDLPSKKDPLAGMIQYEHMDNIMNVTPVIIEYNIDTAGGQSGSPILALINGEIYIVGIHNNGTNENYGRNENSGTRIIPKVMDWINQWKQV